MEILSGDRFASNTIQVSWALGKRDFLGAVNVALEQRHLLRRHDFQVMYRSINVRYVLSLEGGH